MSTPATSKELLESARGHRAFFCAFPELISVTSDCIAENFARIRLERARTEPSDPSSHISRESDLDFADQTDEEIEKWCTGIADEWRSGLEAKVYDEIWPSEMEGIKCWVGFLGELGIAESAINPNGN